MVDTSTDAQYTLLRMMSESVKTGVERQGDVVVMRIAARSIFRRYADNHMFSFEEILYHKDPRSVIDTAFRTLCRTMIQAMLHEERRN